MEEDQKRVWVFIGAGVVALTAIGVYMYYRSAQKSPEDSKVKMVEDMIREAELLIRQHR